MGDRRLQKAPRLAQRRYVLQTGSIVLSGSSEVLLESEQVRQAYLGI